MPRHDLCFKRPQDAGWLVRELVLDKRTGRWIKKAWLLNEDRTKNVCPPLHYVDCEFDNGAVHLRGEKRDSLTGKLSAMAGTAK